MSAEAIHVFTGTALFIALAFAPAAVLGVLVLGTGVVGRRRKL